MLPGNAPARSRTPISRSQVRRPNHYTTEPPTAGDYCIYSWLSVVSLCVCLLVCLCLYLYDCLSVYTVMSVCVSVSLSSIVKISKSAGSLLKPHVSLLVVSLLESVTTLEPQMMNYLSLHAAANQDAADKVSLSLMCV